MENRKEQGYSEVFVLLLIRTNSVFSVSPRVFCWVALAFVKWPALGYLTFELLAVSGVENIATATTCSALGALGTIMLAGEAGFFPAVL